MQIFTPVVFTFCNPKVQYRCFLLPTQLPLEDSGLQAINIGTAIDCTGGG